MKAKIYALIGGNESPSRNSKEIVALINTNHVIFRDALIQNCFKDKLYEWLVCKTLEGAKGMQILDGEGQWYIHLMFTLGYE